MTKSILIILLFCLTCNITLANTTTKAAQIVQYEKMKKIKEDELARSLFEVSGQVEDIILKWCITQIQVSTNK